LIKIIWDYFINILGPILYKKKYFKEINILIYIKNKMTEYKCKICNYSSRWFKDMKKHLEKTTICKMKPNMYFENSIDQNIILSLLPDDERLKNLIIKVKSKDYKDLYQSRRRFLMRRLSGQEDDKKCCSYCNKKFSKIQELREHVLIDCFLEEISEKNNNSTNINSSNDNTTSIINNIDNFQKITNINNSTNIDNSIKINNSINIDNSTNIILNIQTPISFDKSWDISDIDTLSKKLEILCSDVLYTKLLKKILENKNNLNVIYDKKNNIGFVYKNENEKYIDMDINDIVDTSMKKLHENLLEINGCVKNHKNDKNHPEYAEYCHEKEVKINNKFTDFQDKFSIKKNVVNMISEILDDKKDESTEIFKNILNEKIQDK